AGTLGVLVLFVAVMLIFFICRLPKYLNFSYRYSKRTGILLRVLAILLIASTVMSFFAGSVALTPFKPIDKVLYHLDMILGFQQNYWLSVVYKMPWLHELLTIAYYSLTPQVLILPFVAVFLTSEERIYDYFNKVFLLNVIGFSIYYFLPTASPASLLNHQYLVKGQINLAQQFITLHSGKLPHVLGEGLISFPSFHVIWSLMVTLLFRKTWLFYPLLILNIFLWCGTVLLGWHYIVDVIASFILVVMVYIPYKRLLRVLYFAMTQVKRRALRGQSRTIKSQGETA
ncbi:phosphatase PAP2 family protein, partial [Fangia hongkongensis]